MSAIQELAARYAAEDPQFKKAYRKETRKLEISVAMTDLMDETGLSARELARQSHRPLSFIRQLEAGRIDASVSSLEKIANSVGKRLKISFVDE
ncbi:helix-turn-helix domain-containing protein [Bifidobacterium choloepi]|uniref:Helix-turn-helix domain-containing protein n=1 Tax=Bifidobacterium choloepi TaxID=2614131 RepID=A0A6I5N7C2_9BIFI|nr:helix-turn-helix transcriptional regulator [Bifidobacterium choloepi]NEG69741.1 helix-turn-helix domain-containing protein [Bifidobacterium choloepi]